MIIPIDQVIKSDLFPQSTHFIQENKGDGVLLRISLSPRDSEDRGSVSRLCVSSDKGGDVNALRLCQLKSTVRNDVPPLSVCYHNG